MIRAGCQGSPGIGEEGEGEQDQRGAAPMPMIAVLRKPMRR